MNNTDLNEDMNLKNKEKKKKEIKIKSNLGINLNNQYNKLLLENELENSINLKENPDLNEYLYPNLNDPNFNIKIAQKKEFSDTKYDGTIYDLKAYIENLNTIDFELSPHQAFVRNFMSFQTPYNSLLLYHGLGTGKCHAKGSKIRMFDGSVQLVEDIKEGDLLMGDDSTPRTVLSLARGKDKMFKIEQEKGESYIVNQEHILCLKKKDDIILEISIIDYLKLKEKEQKELKGYRVPLLFAEKQNNGIPLHSYILGLSYGKPDALSYIPIDFKYNSFKNRIQLLAGIIDSLGSMNKETNLCNLIIEKRELLEDILFLVRSLGLEVVEDVKKNSLLIYITSSFLDFPSEKIKNSFHRQGKNTLESENLSTNIKVSYVGEDEYYGFTIDKNGRYLMNDLTVTHNTCSAIGVAEEMRDYLTQMGISKKIIIVASPNVQDNFKLQLFDERRLKLVDNIWTIKGCIGNKLLKEINPTNMKGLTKDKVISEVKNLINISYEFLGYTQLSNKIIKTAGDGNENSRKKNVQLEFNNSLIIIDEVHNMRISDDNEKNATTAKNLMYIASACQNIRLLLLSATPMFNNYKEILWLINLMNINDKRGFINIKDIFDKDGNFKKDKDGKEIGRELLIRKATGYISYVRGDNPYTFPFRVYPNLFAPDHTFHNKNEYPKYQLNCKLIPEDKKMNKISIYLNKIGEYQQLGYKYVMDRLRKQEENNEEKRNTFGYTDLQLPLECLNIVYPVDGLEELVDKLEPCIYTEEEEVQPDLMDTDKAMENLDYKNSMNEITNPSLSPFEISIPIKSKIKSKKLEVNKKSSKRESILSETLVPTKSETLVPTISETLVPTISETLVPSMTQTQTNTQKGGLYIDPRGLTGSLGLNNVMIYHDSITPAQKGSFEYKNSKKYGKIFSPQEIGKYSCKIKAICESIYNPKTNMIAKGIILIYSSYIDAGLIPVALALEEMGFVRYQNSKVSTKTPSLFKNAPTEVVDVRTMKPSHNKNDFKAAKYIMITGDPRLSPNNDVDVKALTSDDNLNGENIKVVLISQAGSEGLDFKAIRQTHIMEPWYNMNRIEQITGRAIRNLSHKDLPLEERNVEIFLHGTILNNAEEESVDLYIYRIAELKAVQIGKITRILKQTSVDCIINHEQTEFTVENFKKIANNLNVKQILSNGKVINHFPIGDEPNSAVCDYMDSCEYKCLPDIKLDEKKINLDSYNESFMLVNSDKIIQKIRELMKERYFYNKTELFAYLNTPKAYPSSQIYAALTLMINDSTEYILDRYGRTGYLINIGEYYLFQPSELNYKNISIYDRSVPIDFKHNVVEFNIKPNLDKNALDTEGIKQISKNEKNNGKEILDEMENNYNITKSTEKVERGEDNWYKYCSVVISKMKAEGISLEELQDNLIDHMIESLRMEEKIDLLNYIDLDCSNKRETTNNLLLTKIQKYFCNKIIYSKNITALVLLEGPSKTKDLNVFILKENKWIKAEPEDIRDISLLMNEKYKPLSNLNTFVGFMGFEEKNKYMVFKIKDTSKSRNTGSRCDQAGKKKTMDILNEIIGTSKYTKENTKGMVQQELCILQEFILRNYERSKKDGKSWFLTTELAVINDF